MARLLIVSEGFREQVLNLKLGVNRFGRSPKNDFVIEHPTVSARHCEIELGEGELILRDCHSTNGTFVGGQLIVEARLTTGEKFCLGDVELLVEDVEVQIAIPHYDLPDERPAPPVVLSDGSLMCPRHPETRATHQCTHCLEIMCDACIHKLRRRGGKLHKFCPKCSHECLPLGGDKKKKRSFLGMLAKTIKLPFALGSKHKHEGSSSTEG
jgi:hypothetical protein